jgi:D-3-phosphoglycerate dehydrogenase
LITAKFATNGEQVEYAGTLAWDRTPRIVQINQFQFDVIPTKYMLFAQHIDRPGVIGYFASTLGDANVNIASMQLARREKGKEAMMIYSIDSPVNEETLNKLRQLDCIKIVKAVTM